MSRVAAVGARQVPLAPCGRCGSMAPPQGTVWLPLGHAFSHGQRMAAVGRGLFQWARMVAVKTWPVHFATYGRRCCVACPLGIVWPPWGRGPYPGPRMAVVGVWPLPLAPSNCVGAWPVP